MTSVLRHALTNLDHSTQTATCPVCGPGVLYVRRGPNTRPTCPKSSSNTYRKYQYERKFGTSYSEKERLFEKQEGLCGICRMELSLSDGSAKQDHDHATGAIRGLLCQRCNAGIGMFLDDPIRLQAAIQYLVDHSQ